MKKWTKKIHVKHKTRRNSAQKVYRGGSGKERGRVREKEREREKKKKREKELESADDS